MSSTKDLQGKESQLDAVKTWYHLPAEALKYLVKYSTSYSLTAKEQVCNMPNCQKFWSI